MNELKPEDVMRALECCSQNNCAGCPQDEIGIYRECISLTMSHALALLREKDAEIEHHIKTITQNAQLSLEVTMDKIRKARVEAITEFAEKLKEAVKYIPWCDYPPVIECIDQIVKEMRGG